MTRNRWRCSVVLFLACASNFECGCGIVAYLESYTAPEFDVYRLTTDAFPDWWECRFERLGTVCEATITRNDNGEYVAELAVSSNDQFTYDDVSAGEAVVPAEESSQLDLTYLPPRVLTEQEVAQMKALFSDLHINRNPSPFGLVCCLGTRLQRIHRWDDVQLGTHTRDGAMIDYRDSGGIMAFLSDLVPPDPMTP